MVTIEIKEVELKRAMAKVDALGKSVTVRQRKAALRKGALIVRDTARANVPVADKVVKRYNTPKLDGKLRAPKGQGVVVEEYQPGTLKNDINVKSLRRSPDLFVGPGTSTKRPVAFWAHWIEYGNRHIKGVGYMRKGVQTAKSAALGQMVKDFGRLYDRTIKKIAKSK